jgi:hypothetical protein
MWECLITEEAGFEVFLAVLVFYVDQRNAPDSALVTMSLCWYFANSIEIFIEVNVD